MRTLDPIKQYLGLQERLRREKTEIEQRLSEINHALAGAQIRANSRAAATARPHKTMRRGRRVKNDLSLKEAALRVIRGRPLNRQEILREVQKIGYRFGSNNPLNTLGATLYGNKKVFKNNGGRFSPAK